MKYLKASNFHPGSWWILGLAVAFTAGASHNPILLLALIAGTIAVIVTFREPNPWSQSLRFYLGLSLSIIAIRVAFRIIFNYGAFAAVSAGSDQAFLLPQLSLNLGFLGDISFFGQVSKLALASAFIDGLRMATIVMSMGMANSLANPKRLLKATPSALYEIASALAIAVNLAPQLISSSSRVNQARKLRGRSRGVRALQSIVVPILEDTLEKSLSLAASMDARGFGRRGTSSGRELILARSASFIAVAAAGTGSYLLLTTNLDLLVFALVALSLGGVYLTVRLNKTRMIRTAYNPSRWSRGDLALIAASCVLVLMSVFGVTG